MNAGNTLLNKAEKADQMAIQQLTGLDLSSLTPTEAGVLIGAQIGAATIPIIGGCAGRACGLDLQLRSLGLPLAGLRWSRGGRNTYFQWRNASGRACQQRDDWWGGRQPGGELSRWLWFKLPLRGRSEYHAPLLMNPLRHAGVAQMLLFTLTRQSNPIRRFRPDGQRLVQRDGR